MLFVSINAYESGMDTLKRRKKRRKLKLGKVLLILIISIILIILFIRQSQQDGLAKKPSGSIDNVNQKKTTTNSNNAVKLAAEKYKIKKKLQAYLDKVTADKTASVSFYNLSPEKNSSAENASNSTLYTEGNLAVSANASTPAISASTYKLFITAYLFNEAKNNNFTWNTSSIDGFYNMIVYSQNDFAETELATYGLSSINNFIKSQNWYSPVFTNSNDATTTAKSLEELLLQLYHGTGAFSNSTNRAKLLSLMGKQVYRTGIPTGAAEAMKGTTVTDKVGFLNDVNNDAGIVTLPNGQRYILVIMTHGHNQSGFSGFPRIATITKKVQSIVYGN
ncbi:Beta-lactamase class A [Liquorilactobacillus cacaonum DSM 21116]|uniref:Beta-lactamase class A n=1 Tax=Liquorilactobacillus cacaonum DSM 21116 TaxID=1423729 RepID=A0A0R2CG31_9LACO|nr:Beta-lactamase class A [Liquorilactobacillus cacaonum DSM 21116]